MRKATHTVNLRQSRSVVAMTIRAPPRKEKERQAMRAVFSNLEDAYEAGYADGMAEIRKRYRRRQERKARRWYFIKQKLYGVALLIATVFAVWVLDGDATIAIITVPMGLLCLFGKEMLIVDKYYWEHEDE